MTANRMTPEDSAFWKMESDVSRMHSVTLAIFAGPAPDLDDLRHRLARQVPLVPRFRQRVAEVPFDLGRPMWVDDADFDLDDHLEVTSAPGGMASLTELVSLIVSEPLDRTRPLWLLTMVTDLPDDRWAIVSKVHHSMIDGLFGTEPLAILIDESLANRPPAVHWDPSPPPSPGQLLGSSMADLALNPAEQLRFARAQNRRNRRRVSRVAGRARPDDTTDATGLRGPVGGNRTWSSLVVDLDPIRQARRVTGATTHELVLALVTSGIRELLAARDESGAYWPTVRAIVPMAVTDRAAAFHGGIEADIIELPTGQPALDGRIAELHHLSDKARARPATGPAAIQAQVGMSGLAAPALASLGLREATRRGVADRRADTVVVNVPGPRHRITVLDRPMEEIHPVMPLAAGVRLSVGAFSYLDHLTFGVTADRDSVPDAAVVTSGIRRALAELTDHYLE